MKSRDSNKYMWSPIGGLVFLLLLFILMILSLATAYLVPKEMRGVIGAYIPEPVAWGLAISMVIGFSLVPVYKFLTARWLAILTVVGAVPWILVPFIWEAFPDLTLTAIGVSALGYLGTALGRDIVQLKKDPQSLRRWLVSSARGRFVEVAIYLVVAIILVAVFVLYVISPAT